MYLTVKKFDPCPAGMTRGVCVDVIDLGTLQFAGNVEPKQYLRVVYETERRNKEGRRFVVAHQFSASWGGGSKPSNLRKLVDQWLGRVHTDDELAKFDTESLIGRPALLNIVHRPNKTGQVYANVALVSPLLDGMEPLAPSGQYVRDKDRPFAEQARQKMAERAANRSQGQAQPEAWEESQLDPTQADSTSGNPAPVPF